MDYERNERGQYLHPEYGYPICGEGKKHPNKYGDYICLDRPTRGRMKCRRHGGKTLRGAAHPNFKGAGRSKFMPAQLATRYEAAVADPQLGDLTTNIALREAFIRERLAALDKAPDPAKVWRDMSASLNALEVAYSQADSTKMAQSLRAMRGLISERTRYHQTRNEIEGALNDQRRDIVDRDTLSLKGENAIAVKDLMSFMGAVVTLLMQHVTNQQELQQVLNGVDNLLTLPGQSLGARAGANGKSNNS